ncbi:RNA polymerase sigma-70 factor [Sunxiuqinia sp. A32]|uniref:RNA polymerase sigma-70 factor n=1 Tax=Sunxiuqinia sp. A32 TaxID=3461496 RepID=UPI004045BF64
MNNSTQTNLILTNVSSFENFFKRNYALACLVAMKYLKDEQKAEDIVQEVFINLWQKRDELNIHSNLKQYLLNAVRNKSLNLLQREHKFDDLTSQNMDGAILEEPDLKFSDEELSVKISESIDLLPPQCRKIFMMAYLDNLTYKEIANTLNLSKNTIKTQMGIAYKILRENLKNYFIAQLIVLFRKLDR